MTIKETITHVPGDRYGGGRFDYTVDKSLNTTGRMAVELLREWKIPLIPIEGGHRIMTTDELVGKAFDVAEAFLDEAAKRGHLLDVLTVTEQ